MAKSFNTVLVSHVGNSGDLVHKYDFYVTVIVESDPQGLSVKLKRDPNNRRIEDLYEFPVHNLTECARMGSNSYLFNIEGESLCLRFRKDPDLQHFHSLIQEAKVGKGKSVFSERTDDSSAAQYFRFYGYLSQQQNMLQDYVRTSTYQRAMLTNSDDFRDKVVLDVGAGSGILSFFAAQAGARRIYAVEASSMAQHAEILVASNNMKDKIHVIEGKIEEVELPEMVDVIIAEPLGYMLYNERMLETYLHSKKWLKPGGIMFPSRGDLHIAPFMDDLLFMDLTSKANFWLQTCFHGVDLSSMRDAAMKEYFRQPIVDTFDIRICMAKSVKHSVDFTQAQESDLHRIEIPLEFHLLESGTVHGLAFWFDVAFAGNNQTVWMSTAPTEPLTHWYQVRCLLKNPIFSKAGQLLTGKVILQANQRQSYDVTIDLSIEGNEHTRSINTLDLNNPYFCYTGQPVAPPPGMSSTSPSEAYWTQLDAQGARQAVNMVNGISANGLGEVQMDYSQNYTSIGGLVSQPNIHPGSISSTGRQRAGPGPGTAALTGGAQLIGGRISPTLFTSPCDNQTSTRGRSAVPGGKGKVQALAQRPRPAAHSSSAAECPPHYSHLRVRTKHPPGVDQQYREAEGRSRAWHSDLDRRRTAHRRRNLPHTVHISDNISRDYVEDTDEDPDFAPSESEDDSGEESLEVSVNESDLAEENNENESITNGCNYDDDWEFNEGYRVRRKSI